MAEYAAEHPDDESAAMLEWMHQEQLERQQREDAALERCRLLMTELQQLINELQSNRNRKSTQ